MRKASWCVWVVLTCLPAVEVHKDHIRVDRLPLLHTLHNLGEVLGGAHGPLNGVAPTLRDSQLAKQVCTA